MPYETTDELGRILERHKEKAAAARAAAELQARDEDTVRHDCGPRLRDVALPVRREWSKRLAVEGFPTSVDDRLGCRPPCLVFRLTPSRGPESALKLACMTGLTVRFSHSVGGKDVGTDFETPLGDLDARVIVQGLSRFVTKALDATIVQPCEEPAVARP
jgi:hypothetical protein